MANRRKKKSQQGKKLNALQEEMIVQAYALCGNKNQVARNMGVSWPTIQKVLKKAEKDHTLQQVRANTLNDIAGKIHHKTDQIIESISEEDLESGLIKKYDADGELLSARNYGPSLMQKVTSAAILTDKMKVVEDTKRAIMMDQENHQATLPLPQDVEAALQQVGDRVRRLRILDVQFDDKHPEVTEKVQDIAHRVSLDQDVEDVEFEDLDFDNPEG